MSEQVLDSSRGVGLAAAAVARALAAPEPGTVAALHTVCWPAGDPELLRGVAAGPSALEGLEPAVSPAPQRDDEGRAAAR